MPCDITFSVVKARSPLKYTIPKNHESAVPKINRLRGRFNFLKFKYMYASLAKYMKRIIKYRANPTLERNRDS